MYFRLLKRRLLKKKDWLGKEKQKSEENRGRRSLIERGGAIQVIGRDIVIKIGIGSGIGIQTETQIVQDLGTMKLEVIEMGEGGWILGSGMEETEAETGTTIGADHVPLLSVATEGDHVPPLSIATEGLEIQFAPNSGIS